ncbi:unnamed protein product, partial [Iphiclides podalirius]
MSQHQTGYCMQMMTQVEAAKQQVQLSDSYLPVAMQVIAHLTDQMAFEVKDEPGTKPPTTKPTMAKPTTTKPPQSKPTTTAKPLYVTSDYFETLQHSDITTPFHRPGYYAPASPPKPSERQQSSDFIQNNPDFNSTQYQFQQPYNIPSYNPQNNQDTQQFYIPPGTLQPQSFPPQNQQYGFTQNNQQLNNSQNLYQYNPFLQNQQQYSQNQYGVMTFDFPQYNPIQPQNVRNEDPLLSAHHEEVKPLLEPTPESPQLLPPHFEADVDKISSRSKGFDEDELTEENLQYLSQNVREMIRMANDPYDERLIDVWDGLRAHPAEPTPKGKLSASNLRLLLLYDLLSREAKRQRLSDYSGFSPDVMKTLVESSGGGARAQLSMALSKMVERHDCAHEYANNRAKEMVAELAKDESKLSSEIRYLQPLVYKY